MKNSKFTKVMNTWDVIVIAFGAMIGWGWVVCSGDWIQSAGTMGTVLGFVLGGLVIFFVGLSYAELTTAMPECGGEHVFSFKAFDPIGSFICTWYLILSYVGVVCFESCSFPTIIQYIWPGFMKCKLYTVAGFDIYLSWLIVAVVMAALITYINIRGIKVAAIFQTILTAVIAIVGISLVVASAIKGDASNIEGQFFIGDGTSNVIFNILKISVVAPFFLFGFDVIPQVAEEINVPLKKLGKLMILSILMAIGFYALVVFAIGFAMNSDAIKESMQGSGLVAADAMAKVFNSQVMAKVLIIGGMCGIVTSWNSFMIGGSRAVYAMADSYMLPKVFANLHPKHKTPTMALLLVGVLSIIAPFFGRKMLVWVSDAASFSCCLAYFIVTISFLKLRKSAPDMERPYKVKNWILVGGIGAFMTAGIVIMDLIPGTPCALTKEELVITVGWTVLGILFAIFAKLKYGDKFGSNIDTLSHNAQKNI